MIGTVVPHARRAAWLAVLACIAGASCSPAGPPAQAVVPTEVPLEVPRLGDAGASSSSGGIRFGRVPSKAGDRWSVSVRAESRMEEAQSGEQRSGYESDFEVEVLETNGVAPSRVRLRFVRNVNVYQGADKPTAIDGKTYVVDARPPHVRDRADGAAPEDEAQRVLDVFPELGMRTGIDQVLPDEAMHVGERRDDLAGAVLSVLHPRAWNLRSGTATLARVDAGEAVFATTLDATSGSGVHMVVSGDVRVRIRDARLTAIALHGTYDLGPSTSGVVDLRRSVRDAPPRDP